MTESLVTQLEQQLEACKSRRRAAIEAAEAMVTRANRDFDTDAVPIMRRLNSLRPPEEQVRAPTTTTTRKPRKQAEPNMEGLSPEDQQHYRELLARKGK